MSGPATEMVPAHAVASGQFVRTSDGDWMKVLASYAGGGGASSSATVWFVEGYVEGKPTARICGDPGDRIEVRS